MEIPWLSLIHFTSLINIAGPEVLAADPPPAAYSVETLALAVAAGALAALGAGFAAGYICGRRCKKDEDDNMPYPDTEYEYFEQRQNINRLVALSVLISAIDTSVNLNLLNSKVSRSLLIIFYTRCFYIVLHMSMAFTFLLLRHGAESLIA